jgi:hypothetical protein
MFQFPGLAFRINPEFPLARKGCPIRVSADQFVFANPRSLSQLITPFFASESLGIPRTLFVTFFFTEPLYRFFILVTQCFLILKFTFVVSHHAKEL